MLDGRHIPRHPFDADAPALSAQVPMIVGTVLDERPCRMGPFDMDEAALLADAESRRPGQRAHMDTDSSFRVAAQNQSQRKAAQGQGAPPA
ncbi:hypothetical protein AACH10_22775 [Ideonella sp. DXS22W]|uniref:Uncharacterized protein n=1 Tax=Pseudaquabacterium inlustre TaxID=2984192 RepID=A0ABU9CMQ4_9BURK